MSNRVKEEERIEKIIRGLLKQPENRRCINCNSLGPQYVCTTFWTFVCTNCSGVHREFTHRVKSVSMAKFNAEEANALQAGGNERARQIYFKSWDPQRNSYPDGSNLHRLREFIRHVYVDRKYSGGNGNDKLSMVKSNLRNESYERCSFEKSSFGSREDALDRRSFHRDCKSGIDEEKYTRFDDKSLKNMMEERSPRFIQENVRPGSHRGRATRFEIVDDRFRDDGNVKRYDRYAGKETRVEISSPCSQKSRGTSLPEIRPVREILRDKFQSLTVSEPVKANDGKETDANTQDSTKGNQKQNHTQNLSSLIDFDANPEPNDTTTSAATSTAETTNNSTNANSVESLLFDFSAPMSSNTVVTSQMPETPSTATAALSNISMPTDVKSRNLPEISVSVGTLSVPNKDTDQTLNTNSGNSTAQVTEARQQQNSSPASNEVKPVSSVPFQQSLQFAESGDGSMLNQRKELPADLFASNFTGLTPSVPDWHHHGMNYGMRFRPPAMSMAAFPNPTRPSNPFDIGDERPQVQAAMFPSMSLAPVSLPQMPPPGTFLQPQPSSPYATAFSSHATPYGINIPFTRPQVINVEFGGSYDAFASPKPIHQSVGAESINADTPSSRGVNPFV